MLPVKVLVVRINPSIDKYNDIVLFSKRLAKVNALLEAVRPPKFPEPKK